MKQTSVEWYAKQMQLKEKFTQEEFNNITNQAKEMEKQQQGYSKEDLEVAFQSGFTNGFNINSVTFEEWFEQFNK
jgi:hypothetical protein